MMIAFVSHRFFDQELTPSSPEADGKTNGKSFPISIGQKEEEQSDCDTQIRFQSEKQFCCMNVSPSCSLFQTRPFLVSVNDGEQVEPCVKASSLNA
jgi:hypothetical protein